MPSMPGIRTSMNTTSGVRSRACVDRLLAAPGLADHDHGVFGELEGGAQAFTRDRVVIDDQGADRRSCLSLYRQAGIVDEASIGPPNEGTSAWTSRTVATRTDDAPAPADGAGPSRPRTASARPSSRSSTPSSASTSSTSGLVYEIDDRRGRRRRHPLLADHDGVSDRAADRGPDARVPGAPRGDRRGPSRPGVPSAVEPRADVRGGEGSPRASSELATDHAAGGTPA